MRFSPSANKYTDLIMEFLKELVISELKEKRKQGNRSENKAQLIASPKEIAKLFLKSRPKGSFKARKPIKQLPQLKPSFFAQTSAGKKKETKPNLIAR